MVFAAQDEVGTVPHFLSLKEMDVKIGGTSVKRSGQCEVSMKAETITRKSVRKYKGRNLRIFPPRRLQVIEHCCPQRTGTCNDL